MDFSPCATSANVRIAARGDAEAMRAANSAREGATVSKVTGVSTYGAYTARMADAMVDYPCLVLEQDGRVVGFAYAHAQASRAAYRWNAELSVYLEQGATGGGRGRTLYDALLKLLRAQGVKSAYGLVTVPNEASERLHAGCGFQRCWVQSHAGWKAGSWHDVTWYVKELAPFDDDPADPVPFSELARTRPDFVQQVLDEANAALEANVPTDCA